MHRLWSDGRWNKLTIAHGCYWKKCTFCDITLDYIARYDLGARRICSSIASRRIDRRDRADRLSLRRRGGAARGPARARRAPDRAQGRDHVVGQHPLREDVHARARASCSRARAASRSAAGSRSRPIACSASCKRASPSSRSRASRGRSPSAGIMVHAYLMYGFPTETTQETVDSLERVRQLFAAGCVQSAFWHRFAATAHSPIGRAARALRHPPAHREPTVDLRAQRARRSTIRPAPITTRSASGLRKALYNYMHGLGLDEDVANVVREAPLDSSDHRLQGSDPQRSDHALTQRCRSRPHRQVRSWPAWISVATHARCTAASRTASRSGSRSPRRRRPRRLRALHARARDDRDLRDAAVRDVRRVGDACTAPTGSSGPTTGCVAPITRTIFLCIAGTYTPFSLLGLGGDDGHQAARARLDRMRARCGSRGRAGPTHPVR